MVSVLSNDVQTVAYFIDEASCDVKEVDGDGDNILHCAAACGANQVLDYLFEKYRDEVRGLLDCCNNVGMTPEERATNEDKEETAALLAGFRKRA
jgi:hypothetical protein